MGVSVGVIIGPSWTFNPMGDYLLKLLLMFTVALQLFSVLPVGTIKEEGKVADCSVCHASFPFKYFSYYVDND